MRLDWSCFNELSGTGLRLLDDVGGSVLLPSAATLLVVQGRQEALLLGGNGDVVVRDVEPTRVTVDFIGGSLTLELPLGAS